jgi:hypothetical protein
VRFLADINESQGLSLVAVIEDDGHQGGLGRQSCDTQRREEEVDARREQCFVMPTERTGASDEDDENRANDWNERRRLLEQQ